MRRFFVISGVVFLLGPIILLPDNFQKYDVQKSGSLVKMKIESLPSSCIGAKVPYYVKFSYGGKLYDKQTRGSFCDEHHVGEFVDIRIMEGSDFILYPKESALFDLISCFVLSFFGLFLLVTQLKKMENQK